MDNENESLNLSTKNRKSIINSKSEIAQKVVLYFGTVLILFLLSSSFIYFFNKINIKTERANIPASISPTADILSTEESESINREVIGFLPSWSIANKSKVFPENLTQIIYFGLNINEYGEIIKYNEDNLSVLEWTYFNSDYFKEVRKQASSSGTKVLLSIKSFDNETIDNVISNQNATNRLANQLATLIKQYDLDGVNIDFEYFTDSNFPTSKYFAKFLTELSSRLKENNPEIIISVDVNATVVIKDKAYNMTEIAKSVDQIILMAYDYRRQNSTRAGPTSPIDGEKNEHTILKSVESLSGRVPSEKLILGIPFYGYEWQTLNKKFKSPTVPGSGALATYKRVKLLLEENDDIIQSWDNISKSPWLTYTQSGAIKQIYYENEKSITDKANLVKERGMGGIAIWALGYEGNNPDLWEAINPVSIN